MAEVDFGKIKRNDGYHFKGVPKSRGYVSNLESENRETAFSINRGAIRETIWWRLCFLLRR